MRKFLRFSKGFTLVEVMVVVVIVAILASIALPSYANYIKKSRALNAGADLVSLSAALENVYQRKLRYTASDGNVESATNYLQKDNADSLWKPAEASNFNYTVDVTESTYKLTATGKNNSAGCTLTIDQANARTITGGKACGGLTSW